MTYRFNLGKEVIELALPWAIENNTAALTLEGKISPMMTNGLSGLATKDLDLDERMEPID